MIRVILILHITQINILYKDIGIIMIYTLKCCYFISERNVYKTPFIIDFMVELNIIEKKTHNLEGKEFKNRLKS